MSSTVTMPIVLGPELAGIALAPEEFDAVDEADRNYRYELINGRLIVTPPPLEGERDGNEELGHLLRRYRDEHPQGSVLDDTLPEQIVVTRNNRRRADRVVWAGLKRRPDPKSDVPSIVVEWVSKRKRDWLRDYIEKRDEYLAIGVAEYWIFDRFRRTLTVYRGTAAAPEQVVVHEAETYRTPLLPGFELSLAQLLLKADRWR
jgi:Uma2 family endonuclease